jgi:hypothetical protein
VIPEACRRRVAALAVVALTVTGCVGTPFAWLLVDAQPAGAATSPVITSPTTATATTGSPFTFTVTTSSATVPTITAAHLPAGLALVNNQNGTATISGTPLTTDGGIYTATITATVTGAPAAAQKLVLTVDNKPVFHLLTKCSAHVGIALACTTSTPHAYPIPTFSTSSTLPGGVSLTDHHNGTATLGGTPAAGAGGVFHVTITAANGVGLPATETVVLTVTEAPTISSPGTSTLVQGEPITPVTITASGYPVPKLTAAGLPTGLTMKASNGTATISGTPTAAVGSYAVTITAASTSGTTTATLTLVVSGPTVPGAPTVGAVSISSITIGNADAAVSFSPPTSNGGSPITSYTVTALDSTDVYNGGQTVTGPSSPLTISSLVNGDSYTFTVTATNAVGTGPASTPSAAFIPMTESWPPTNASATVPPAPNTAVVTFTPPQLDGGSAITGYTVTAADSTNPANGGQTVTGPSSPVTVTGLVNGDSYTFTVTAANGVGTSISSAPSDAVTPQVPPVPTITSVSPASGTTSGGDAITITGAGFDGASSVVFGTTPAATFTVDSDQTITATTPAEVLGTVDLQVTTPGGTSGLGPSDQFTFTPPPDLAIAVTKPAVVYVGQAFTETYVITNDGGSNAVAPTLTVLNGKASAASVSAASMTCVDTAVGHSGRDGGVTHTGYKCSMPAGQVLVAGASLTLVASFVAGTATIAQQLTVGTTSVQQNLVSHTVTDDTTPLLPAAPGSPTGVSVTQDLGSLVVSFTDGASTSPGAPITSSVVATPVGGGTALSGSVATTTPGAETVTLPGLVGSTTYSVAVTSSDSGGSASAVPIDFTTAPPFLPPGAPAITSASWGSGVNIVVAWTAASAGDSATSDYQVLFTPLSSSLSPVTYDAGAGLIASVVVPSQAIDWSVQVRAENAAGWGPWSPAATVPAFDN